MKGIIDCLKNDRKKLLNIKDILKEGVVNASMLETLHTIANNMEGHCIELTELRNSLFFEKKGVENGKNI
jgi:hypothetical protein